MFEGGSSTSGTVYINYRGDVLAGKPSMGDYFEVRLRGNSYSGYIDLFDVRAFSDGQWFWSAIPEGDGHLVVSATSGQRSPSWRTFPLAEMRETLAAVREKMLAAASPEGSMISTNAAAIVKILFGSQSEQVVMFDSTGSVNGKNGNIYHAAFNWYRDAKVLIVGRVTAYAPNGAPLWDANLNGVGRWAIASPDGSVLMNNISLPAGFPSDVFDETVMLVKERMLAAGGARP
jgi:hypothetical protein